MRQRTGFNMEQHSLPDIPPLNPVPTFESYDNNSIFNGLPHHHHHHPPASNLGPAMSAPPPSLYLPYPPPSHHGAAVDESNPHFMGLGYKRKSDEVVPANYHYLTEPSPPQTAPFSFPHYATTTHPSQPMDQRSVRSRVGAVAMDPPYPHGHNSYSHPFPPPGSIWYDQHSNEGSSSHWLQPPFVPFMNGNGSSTDSGNVCIPRYHEASSSRNDTPFAYPSPNYFNHPPPPPPLTLYPHMASASYAAPVNASYINVRPVQSTGFRINQQHPRDDFSPAASLRHHGLPHLRAIPAHDDEFFGDGDFDDDVDDDHEDMRLDIEGMTYEELLDLSDHIGTVKTGLSEETVKDLLKRRTSISTRINLEELPCTDDLEIDSCTICQETYENQDKIATLDCKHEYHAECLEKWLVIKNVCPICKSEALVMEKNKER